MAISSKQLDGVTSCMKRRWTHINQCINKADRELLWARQSITNADSDIRISIDYIFVIRFRGNEYIIYGKKHCRECCTENIARKRVGERLYFVSRPPFFECYIFHTIREQGSALTGLKNFLVRANMAMTRAKIFETYLAASCNKISRMIKVSQRHFKAFFQGLKDASSSELWD